MLPSVPTRGIQHRHDDRNLRHLEGLNRSVLIERLCLFEGVCCLRRRGSPLPEELHITGDTWLILPVVICLSQRLSHASLSICCIVETADGSLKQL